MADFLFEIGLEEVPARMIAGAQAELEQRVVKMLERERLVQSGAVTKSFATPRRLAVWVKDVAARQDDLAEELVGPSVKVAYKDGVATPAAMAFAKKAGVEVSALKTVTNAKGEYLAATTVKAGRGASEVIAGELPKELAGIYWAKNMYWRPGKPERFVRPVRWMVALLGNEVVPVSFGGYEAGAVTYGHRVLFGDAPIALGAPSEYEDALLSGFVIADVEVRRQRIRKALDKVTRTVDGLRWREDHGLVDKLTQLTEWPSVVMGGFEPEYLVLPEEVLVTVMRDHQSYFAVEDRDGKLAPYFLAVLNTETDTTGEAVIRHGNERVLRARFNDARFFWEFDQRVPLVERVKLLENVTFQKELGSYSVKTERVRELSHQLLNESIFLSGEDGFRNLVDRAALLSKTDLMTEMVKEFTELQGIVGGLYARHQGEADAVSYAIYDQYKPTNFADSVPRNPVGEIVAIADKMSSIVDLFAIGLEPTSSKDPFALRRAGNGVIKVLAEGISGKYLDLNRVLWASIKTSKQDSAMKSRAQIMNFMLDRLDFYLRQACGLMPTTSKAILAGSLVLDINKRSDKNALVNTVSFARVLNEGATDEEVTAISALFKRIRNILKQALANGEAFSPQVNKTRLKEPAEQALYEAIVHVEISSQQLYEAENYRQLIQEIAGLSQPLSNFFEHLMVMDSNPMIRETRLSLLQYAEAVVRKFADFSEIVVAG